MEKSSETLTYPFYAVRRYVRSRFGPNLPIPQRASRWKEHPSRKWRSYFIHFRSPLRSTCPRLPLQRSILFCTCLDHLSFTPRQSSRTAAIPRASSASTPDTAAVTAASVTGAPSRTFCLLQLTADWSAIRGLAMSPI